MKLEALTLTLLCLGAVLPQHISIAQASAEACQLSSTGSQSSTSNGAPVGCVSAVTQQKGVKTGAHTGALLMALRTLQSISDGVDEDPPASGPATGADIYMGTDGKVVAAEDIETAGKPASCGGINAGSSSGGGGGMGICQDEHHPQQGPILYHRTGDKSAVPVADTQPQQQQQQQQPAEQGMAVESSQDLDPLILLASGMDLLGLQAASARPNTGSYRWRAGTGKDRNPAGSRLPAHRPARRRLQQLYVGPYFAFPNSLNL